uniref:Autophagy protein 5 n=1 Tax=Dugesia japonica TaxID=6161 RepID=A0A2S1BJG8_DUGJA|nr:Atg5 [Dugesia japonica]
MVDMDIIKTVWEGKLPICFNLSEKDTYSYEKLTPVYMLVPRVSYLPLFSEKLQNHFKRLINHQEEFKVWFSADKIPLKSHYPVGLLYDCASNQSLPWSITVHFSNFPSDKLIDLSKEENLESHFIYTVKEADYLKSRGLLIQSFQQKEMESIWAGLKTDNFEQFWSINRKLMDYEKIAHESNKAGGENPVVHNGFKCIPCRVYLPDRIGFVQKLIKSMHDNGDQYVLSDLIAILELPLDNVTNYKFIIHGIDVPSNSPLQWLSENFSYPDNFLHILVKTVIEQM